MVLEAMASGLAVVCTDFASAREVIPDEQIGIIVARDNVEQLSNSIIELLGDDERRASLGQAARAHVLNHYSWDTHVAAMESLYAVRAGRPA